MLSTRIRLIPVILSVGFGKGIKTNFIRGEKFFELSDHLGNVLVTVSDKKIGVDQNSDGTIDYYNADVISAQDFYPGGMLMPGRIHTSGNDYRYSINGQQKTSEIVPNTTTAEYWQYDARVVRRWNVDPKPTTGLSSYNCFAGNPIWYSDPKGDTLQSLTTFILRDMARKAGFTGKGIVFNRQVGKAFEGIALASQGILIENTIPFASQERLQNTGSSSVVIPDGVKSVTEIKSQLFPRPRLKTTIYPQSSFYEVKAVNGSIRLSSSNYQIQGELEAVRNSVGARKAGRGTMTFVTTTNTVIAPDVISYANKHGIQLYQVFAFRETDDNSIHFTPPIPLNNSSKYQGSINVTPLAKIADPFFGFTLNRIWVTPENPANLDKEEVQ